jgi:hypothetical protein
MLLLECGVVWVLVSFISGLDSLSSETRLVVHLDKFDTDKPSSFSMGGTCFWICCFWSHVAAVTITAAIMLPEPVVAELLLKALYCIGIMLWRMLRSGLIRIM